MKTTFLPTLALVLATMLTPQIHRASSPPVLGNEEEALETMPAASLASADLQPGAAKVAGRNVNVRAKATIQSEVVAQLQDGDEVFVEEVIIRPDAQAKDPTRWAQITYPASAAAWVHSLYIDAATGTVKPKTLNVRSGPGENFTVIGTLRSDDVVKPLETSENWIKIQPPKGATAYVAAKLLRQEAPPVAEVEHPVTEPTETTVVASETEIVTSTETGEPEMVAVTDTTEIVATEGATTVTDTNTTAADLSLEPLPDVAPEIEPVIEEPLPPRIVEREGIVRGHTSVHAPSFYKLVSPDNGVMIDYLYTSSDLDLSRYLGLRIVATGEEALDPRWRTPVLTLKKIVLVE